jgi:hypothetical protein
MISRIFPPRQFTVMDTPNGNVYSYEQSSFWRFTRFCGKVGLFLWAAWSTYVFVYHRPLLQMRTQQLEQVRDTHARHMTDLQTYLAKYTTLARDLNIIDDKILNAKDTSDKEKEALMNSRSKTWGELEFLRTRIVEMLKDKIEIATDTELEYFKFYLGDVETVRGRDRFIPFETLGEEGKPSYPSQEWVQIFDVEDSTEPVSKTLYYTSKADCMDRMQPISIANAIPLDFPCIAKGQQIYIKAIGNDKIVYMAAQSPEEAEEMLNHITDVAEKEKHTAYLK